MKSRVRTFRLFPLAGKGHYFLVILYHSPADFLHKVQKVWGETTYACTTVFPPSKRIRKVGILEFHPDSLTHDLIAHEIDHAVTGYMDCFLSRPLLKSESEEDELRAQMVGRLHAQFWSELD